MILVVPEEVEARRVGHEEVSAAYEAVV